MLLLYSCDKVVLIILTAYSGPTAGMDPENSEEGAEKLFGESATSLHITGTAQGEGLRGL